MQSGRERKQLEQKIKEGTALADELEDLLFDTMEGRFFDNDINTLSATIQHIDKYAGFDDNLPLEYVRVHAHVYGFCVHSCANNLHGI